MFQRIRNFMVPVLDEEVQNEIDKESLNSLHILSLATFAFELLALCVFVLTRKQFDEEAWISIGSVVFCIISCVIVFFMTTGMQKNGRISHRYVTAFKVFFVLVLSAWAIWVSWRHYNQDDQLLTFLAVELMVVCFIAFKPWLSTLLSVFIYTGLFAVLYSVDAAASLNVFNFAVLVLVSIAGMIVRFHFQVRLSEKSVLLQRKNTELDYLSHHDVLTGLRNRLALNKDVDTVIEKSTRAFMIDLDYFKEFNDKYGHLAGDQILQDTAKRLKELYPDSYCYRYGGDEFLVISCCEEVYQNDIYRFKAPVVGDMFIQLSIGKAEGTPKDHEEVFALISAADRGLYEVKRKTHSPEFGGHDRRRPRP